MIFYLFLKAFNNSKWCVFKLKINGELTQLPPKKKLLEEIKSLLNDDQAELLALDESVWLTIVSTESSYQSLQQKWISGFTFGLAGSIVTNLSVLVINTNPKT